MATKKSVTDWEGAELEVGEWESASSGGFAPLWKPEQGESVIVQVLSVSPFKSKKGKKTSKKEMQPSYAIECILMQGSSLANFYKSKGNHIDVKIGDTVTLGSSYNLIGPDKLVMIEKNGAIISPMAELLKEDNKSFRVVFNGKIKTEGARSVNDFTVQFPKGYKEKLAQQRG